jgi:hypothetical protein
MEEEVRQRSKRGSYGSELALDDVYKFLAFSPSLNVASLYIDEDFAVLYDLLAKNNVTLQYITFCENVQDSVTKAKIEWLLTLTRYHRQCLLGMATHPAEDVAALSVVAEGVPGVDQGLPGPVGLRSPIPLGAWPSVLGRISTDNRADVMYHFLGKMPKQFLLQLLPLRPPGRGLKRAAPSLDHGTH